MKRTIMSVDAGKGFTKYARTETNGEILTKQFHTKYTLQDGLNELGLVGADSFKVTYRGENYILGVQGEKDLREIRTKKHDMHRLSTLVAATQMIQPEDEKISLVVSMPGTSYKAVEEREAFQEFYKGEGKIEISVNNKDYNFEIENVLAMPEGPAFMFRHTDLCKGKVAVIDLGHLNIGITELNGLNVSNMVSLDEGGEVLEQMAIEKLEAQIGEKISRDRIVKTLQDGYYTLFGDKVEKTNTTITDVKNVYVDELIRKAKSKGVNLAEMDAIYFIGGTALLLQNDIKNHEKLGKVGCVMDDSKWINVVGNLIYGEGVMNE